MLNSLLSKKNKEEKCVIKKSRDRRLVVYTPIRGCLTKYRSYFLSQLSQPSINIRHVRNEFTLISPRPLGLLLKICHVQVPAGLCIKTRLSAQPYNTHFHKKGCVLGLVLKVRVFYTPK